MKSGYSKIYWRDLIPNWILQLTYNESWRMKTGYSTGRGTGEIGTNSRLIWVRTAESFFEIVQQEGITNFIGEGKQGRYEDRKTVESFIVVRYKRLITSYLIAAKLFKCSNHGSWHNMHLPWSTTAVVECIMTRGLQKYGTWQPIMNVITSICHLQ